MYWHNAACPTVCSTEVGEDAGCWRWCSQLGAVAVSFCGLATEQPVYVSEHSCQPAERVCTGTCVCACWYQSINDECSAVLRVKVSSITADIFKDSLVLLSTLLSGGETMSIVLVSPLAVFAYVFVLYRPSKPVIFTLRASCGAVYCNWSCLWVCGCVCLFVGQLPR